ncbi:MAG: 2-hydroxyglutaryl-CoA dehydratase, partial [Clostridia bacterium]|nr:2-hydroxyglutaryl-CoA dehydratase [Clostridia bacterium]
MQADKEQDIFAYKQSELLSCINHTEGKLGVVGVPLQLGMYEQLPLWAGFFESLGFKVVLSDNLPCNITSANMSCYPAKLMRGHIESLLDKGVDFIFLPCESFNLNEHRLSHNFICSFVAYYPELLRTENERLNEYNFISPYIDFNIRKDTVIKLYESLKIFGVNKREVSKALKEGYNRLKIYRRNIQNKAREILTKAQEESRQVLVLAGRPYHLDNKINHEINKLLVARGFVVLSEDSVYKSGDNAISQWLYQERLFNAAEFAVKNKNVNFVQLISLGCEFDEITSTEIRYILESNGKPYTQIV